jgi:hypothetical protein
VLEEILDEDLEKLMPLKVVIEEFRLYPDKAAVQGYSQLKTVEVIGVVRYLCAVSEIELIEQGASIKKPARSQMAARGVENEAVKQGAGGHCADAVLHGWYFLSRENQTNKKAEE